MRPVLTREVSGKSDRDGNRLLSASLRKAKQENEKRVDGPLDEYQHTGCIRRSQPLLTASVCCHGGDVDRGAGDRRGRSFCDL